jgi:hypothetical protein
MYNLEFSYIVRRHIASFLEINWLSKNIKLTVNLEVMMSQ